MTSSLPACLVLALSIPMAAHAQVVDPPRADGSSLLSYAKWGALGAAVSAGVLGFIAHGDADDLFDDIEALCDGDPTRCVTNADGSYADAELEGRYQEVLDADARARTALIVSQVAVAATIAMFLLDLDGDPGPENVPYDPDRGLGFRQADDGRTELVYVLPWGSR